MLPLRFCYTCNALNSRIAFSSNASLSARLFATFAKTKGAAKKETPLDSENVKLVRVILTQDVERMGQQGKTIVVKAGLMRHVLYPEGKALYATPENIEKYAKTEEELKASGKSREITNDFEKLLKVLNRKRVEVYRNARADNIDVFLEGPVRSEHITNSLLRQLNIDLHPSQILLGEEGIDSYGTFKVPLNLRTPPPEDAQIQLTVVVAERRASRRIKIQEQLRKEAEDINKESASTQA